MLVILEGQEMEARETVHLYLKEKLEFPDYYGGNLDALWDLLSTDARDLEIIILGCEAILEGLGSYGENLLDTFSAAAEENKNLKVAMY